MALERRDSPRYEVMAQFEITHDGSTYIMAIRNISRSGMFVSTAGVEGLPNVTVNQELELVIFHPKNLENIPVQVRVVRIVLDENPEEQGFGVAFSSVTDDARQQLSDLIDWAKQSIHPPPLPPETSPV